MKALILRNKIVRRFTEIPKFLREFGNVQRPDLLSQKERLAKGIEIVEIEMPDFDPLLQQQGEIYFDEKRKVFTYPVIDKILDFQKIKAQKLREVEHSVDQEVSNSIIFDVLELLVNGKPVPAALKTKFSALAKKKSDMKAEVERITNPAELVKLDVRKIDNTVTRL